MGDAGLVVGAPACAGVAGERAPRGLSWQASYIRKTVVTGSHDAPGKVVVMSAADLVASHDIDHHRTLVFPAGRPR